MRRFPILVRPIKFHFKNILNCYLNCLSLINRQSAHQGHVLYHPFLRSDSTIYRDHYYFPGKEIIGIMLSWAKFCILFSTKPPGCFGFPVSLMEFITMLYWTASNCRPIYLLVLCLLWDTVYTLGWAVGLGVLSHLLDLIYSLLTFPCGTFFTFMSQASLCVHNNIIKTLNMRA